MSTPENITPDSTEEEVKTNEQVVPEHTGEAPAVDGENSSGVLPDTAEGPANEVQAEAPVSDGQPGPGPVLESDTLKYEAKDGLSGRTVQLVPDKVNLVTRTIYVESIHTEQPLILDVQYRAIGSFRETTLRISEELFDELVAKGKRVRYAYVSDFLMNTPEAGQLLQRTYVADYPHWIEMDDVLTQDKAHARYYAPKLSTELERKLFPDFKSEKKLADEEAARESAELAKTVDTIALPQSEKE